MWEKRPFLFLVLAFCAIAAGTIVTMVLPFAWVNTEADRIEAVEPYSPLEQEGRDIYISEGCNNCHTQTVRPLVAEVLRYGEYSKSGEFVYDRPFLWGSKRTGPDLARIGGKYPDAWHYQHFADPQSMIPRSNMPDHDWLADRRIDPDMVRRKMEVLGFPYTEKQIADLSGGNELDALVAYMQKLGSDIDWRKDAQVLVVGEAVNPFPGDAAAVEAGEALYRQHCSACHGKDLEGGIGPELEGGSLADDELYELLFEGIADGGMPSFSSLGSKRLWNIVNFINYGGEDRPVSGESVPPSADVVVEEGDTLYAKHCAVCHGKEFEGGIGPELEAGGYDDDELYELLFEGIADGGMPSFASLGDKYLRQIVNFINYPEGNR